MMRDGKALQMATSHELGQNFARAFDIYYQSEEGQAQLCFTTSWGASTRLVGGLIMAHGDDNGLVLPPAVAPTVVVVVAVREDEEVLAACRSLGEEMAGEGLRAKVDDGRRGSFGRRVTDWEVKGVPVRVEVGPRDLAQGLVTVVRRDTGEKFAVALGEASALARRLAHDIQSDMYAVAKSFRDDHTSDVSSLEEAIVAAESGFARLSWDLVGESGEARLKAEAMTVRCLQRSDGSIPANELEEGLVAVIAKSY
jgi:prolyl-tRNA synthetase